MIKICSVGELCGESRHAIGFMLIRILQYNANRQSKLATDAWNLIAAIVHCSSALDLIGVRFTAGQAQGNGIITVR